MQTDSVEKAAGVGAIGLWAAMHGWLGWLVVLYAACMMLDCLTGTAQAIKTANGVPIKPGKACGIKAGALLWFCQCLDRHFAWANAESYFRTYPSF